MSKSPDKVAELIKIIREEIKWHREEAEERDRLIREESIARETRLFLTIATVKTYTGSKLSAKIQYFLDEILRISNGFTLTDEQMIIIAGRNMSGIAEKWYRAYQEEKLHQIDTFEEFGERLKNQFGQTYDVQTRQAKLMACVQLGKVEDYNKRFYDILNEFPKDYFSEQAKVASYLCNLKTELRCEVKIKDPVNLGDAMKYAMIIESKYTGKANWEKKFIKRPIDRFRFRESDNMEIDHIMSKPNQRPKICFSCQKEGHFAANCPNRPKIESVK